MCVLGFWGCGVAYLSSSIARRLILSGCASSPYPTLLSSARFHLLSPLRTQNSTRRGLVTLYRYLIEQGGTEVKRQRVDIHEPRFSSGRGKVRFGAYEYSLLQLWICLCKRWIGQQKRGRHCWLTKYGSCNTGVKPEITGSVVSRMWGVGGVEVVD